MITIKKGNHTLKVTVGAYRSLYEPMGYVAIGVRRRDNSPQPNSDYSDALMGDDGSEKTYDEQPLEESPLSKLSPRELRQYATELGIDTEGMSKKEIRAAIKELEG